MSNFLDPELEDDEVLIHIVGEVLEAIESLSPELVDMVGRDAVGLRNVDTLLADLVHDSATSSSGTRSDDSVRTVVFSGHDVDVECEFLPDGSTLNGRVEPTDVDCVLEIPGQEVPVTLDGLGRFSVLTSGSRLRFVLTLHSGQRIATPWIFH